MKLFNRTKKEEQNNTETKKEKKENKVLKFVRNHAIGLAGGAIMIVTIAAIAMANSDDNAEETDLDEVILDKLKANGDEFGQPRYDVGIDDAFATVAYSDGDVGFVGKDYIMNLAERIVELRNEEEES